MKHYIKDLIEYFGDENEMVDDDFLDAIEDELDALDKRLTDEDILFLALYSIRKGKPQILEILLENYSFTKSEIQELSEEINDYILNNSDEIEIINKYNKFIRNKNRPYHKKRS